MRSGDDLTGVILHSSISRHRPLPRSWLFASLLVQGLASSTVLPESKVQSKHRGLDLVSAADEIIM